MAQYYNFLRLGREGYRRIHQACYDTARYLGKEIAKLGPFEVLYNGEGGIPALCWSLKDAAKVPYTLYDLSDRLRTRGWQVPAYSMPAHREDLVVMRVLVRHGFSRDMGALLLEDIKRSMAHFEKHPVTSPLSEEESGSFSHSGRSNKK